MYSLALIIFVVYEKKAFVLFFMPIRNPRWLPPQVIVLTQDHMGKYRNIFFSEAIALIEPKLCINHWKVLYKLCAFYVDPCKNLYFSVYMNSLKIAIDFY
jgi:hypothetical protein